MSALPLLLELRLEAQAEDRRDGVTEPHVDAGREADLGADAYERWLLQVWGES